MALEKIHECINAERDKAIAHIKKKVPQQDWEDTFQDAVVAIFEYCTRKKIERIPPETLWTFFTRYRANFFRKPDNHHNERTSVLYLEDEISTIEILSLEYEENRPDAIIDTEELRISVNRALSSIDPYLAVLLRLNYFAGMSDRTMSDFLKIPLGTVKSQLRRAKAEFKREAQRNNLRELLSQ